ncbi:type III secretion system inner membrane ring lipoprotein SctJ [Paracoccus sediminicola]|uniref:type III secretion system inner membrane ring lipoprotein SctJ n=1 Tax=Paracoccus sediminicola TaxID=3017783 RepID=UPI0022EFEBD5|nr:type III secretion inner membrane ring lipoprotein SctJ [Paracoccus sediminicola]WBU57180.1 type III secretion inner membrane ring lipoprotein SctJ [Paracoccus sediminicola]
MRIYRFLIAFCAMLALAGCKAELYTGLTEREANEMVAALMGAGIPASKTGGAEGVAVSVDEARFPEAMALLDKRGLPARQYESMGEVFEKEGLVSSPTEERARLIYALSEELSRTVAEIDGVLSARIHVVLPESDMLGRDVKPSSASVFVRYAADTNVQDYASQIKLLVANSIEGLLYDNITVVMVPAAADAEEAAPVEFANVLGIWTHPGSEQRLWLTLGGLAAAVLALAAGLGLMLWRGSRKPRRSATSPVLTDDLGEEAGP